MRVCCGRSIFAPCVLRPLLIFVMDLSIGDKVFYTRSTRIRVPAKVVGHSDDGYVELEYYQDGVRVVNHGCRIDSISFGIPKLDSPPPSPFMAFPIWHDVPWEGKVACYCLQLG